MCSTGSQHGGLEMAFGVLHTFFLHMGMVVVGLPNGAASGLSGVEEVKGCTPYGAGTIAGSQGERQPSAVELEAARLQGRRVAEIARKLSA
jgi:NAD(P)H dehydrogenase (quinone)